MAQILMPNRPTTARNELNMLVDTLNATILTDSTGIVAFLDFYASISPILYHGIPVVLFAFGAISNTILIVYLVYSRKYRSPVFAFITSLACSDCMMCQAGIASEMLLAPVMPDKDAGYQCSLVMFFMYWTLGCSGCHMVFFAAMRFYQLGFPLKSQANLTANVVFKWCGAIWVLNAVVAVIFDIFHMPVLFYYKGEMVALCGYSGNVEMKDFFGSTMFLLLPGIIVGVLQASKYFRVKSNMSMFTVEQTRQTSDAKAVVIVIVVYFITLLPCYLHPTLHVVFNIPYHKFHMPIWLITCEVAMTNAVFNPYIYMFCSKHIRDDVKKLFCTRYNGGQIKNS